MDRVPPRPPILGGPVTYSLNHLLIEFKYCQTQLQIADPTQLQLIGVEVDFIFPCHKKKERRKEAE